MDAHFEIIGKLWSDFQGGQLPDFGSWNYMLVAVFVMLQGRASSVLSGIAASAGYLNLGLAIAVAVMARMVVDFFWYQVGSTGGVERLTRRRRVASIVEAAQERLRNRPTRVILFSKFSGGLAIPTIVVAGSAGVSRRQMLPASFIGELLWTLPLLLFGYFASDAMGQKEGLSTLTFALPALTLLLLAARSAKNRLQTSRIR